MSPRNVALNVGSKTSRSIVITSGRLRMVNKIGVINMKTSSVANSMVFVLLLEVENAMVRSAMPPAASAVNENRELFLH